MKGLAKRLLVAVAALVVVLAVSACGGTTLAGETTSDGVMTYTAKRCKSDDMAMVSFTLEEGQVLAVHSELESGNLHFVFGSPLDVDAALEAGGEEGDDALVEGLTPDDAVLEYVATGTGDEVLDLEPGDYSLTIYGEDDNPATGTVTLTPQPAE